MKKEKQVFKVGDRVFHHLLGWGDVIDDTNTDVVCVLFDKNKTPRGFVGFNYLSFTEYTLQGFSQERPIQLPKRNELCLVSNSQNFEDLKLGFFKEYKDGFFKVEHNSFIGVLKKEAKNHLSI